MNKEYNILDVKENELLFAGENDSVIIPCKKDEDGGYDIYANFPQDYIEIKPNTTVMIPTKLHCAFNKKWVMLLQERGSTGTKGMGQRAGVIDSGYRGEISVPITNSNKVSIFIAKEDSKIRKKEMINENKYVVYPYEKAICQAIMVEVPNFNIKRIPLEQLKSIPSERGEGRLGSSGK